MYKKLIYFILILSIILIVLIGIKSNLNINKMPEEVNYLSGIISSNKDNILSITTNDNYTYYFKNKEITNNIGTELSINCLGKLVKNGNIQNCEIINYEVIKESEIPQSFIDNGIFSDYYLQAYNKLNELSMDAKIAQMLLVRYQNNNILNIQKEYQFGGYIFFEKDFKGKTKEEVITMIQNIQNVSKIPLLTAIDEEGGIVSRISSNKNLVTTPFKSSQELYNIGGFNAIREDVINKSNILKNLGLNLNLAPVVDVSTNENDYIYKRTLGLDTNLTSIYAETVIEASKNSGVSYTLKHFPGYGNNLDTHKTSSIDYKSYEDLLKYDLPPFISGINKGAEAVMNSHNIVVSIDSVNPASLSSNVHKILREDLNFTGIIITDDLSMGALKDIENIEIRAILAGNDILITSDYKNSFNNIKNGLSNNLITEDNINRIVFRILSWKYYKGLMK